MGQLLRDIKQVLKFLNSLTENDLRSLLYAFLYEHISKGKVQMYHGTGEHGVDIVASVDKEFDPIDKNETLLIQVKKGDISLREWRRNLYGQMSEVFCSSISPPGVIEPTVRRIVLVCIGTLKPEVYDSIRMWNEKIPIPIEILDSVDLSTLFVQRYNFTVDSLKETLCM